MVSALIFGFLHHLSIGENINFERLHIFLFNLCAGGTIVLFFSEGAQRVTGKLSLFFSFSLIFALCSFMEIYYAAVVLAVILAIIVETVRVSKYSFFPFDFFNADVSVSEKFNHAALLCLSLALLISGMVILNNHYFHLVEIPKLELDTFFLGFSFPLTLITMSVMFSLMNNEKSAIMGILKTASFWVINVGVISFLVLILLENYLSQVVITIVLFSGVVMIFLLFVFNTERIQQKAFLTSGMFFLLYTAVSGITYIVTYFVPALHDQYGEILIKLHSYSALYGWNLSGFAVICRFNDFPVKLHSQKLINIHWLTVVVLAPLGHFLWYFSIPAVAGYLYILTIIFFSEKKTPRRKMVYNQ
jgi:hypothetical protein